MPRARINAKLGTLFPELVRFLRVSGRTQKLQGIHTTEFAAVYTALRQDDDGGGASKTEPVNSRLKQGVRTAW